jgi:hypothetical protein
VKRRVTFFIDRLLVDKAKQDVFSSYFQDMLYQHPGTGFAADHAGSVERILKMATFEY